MNTHRHYQMHLIPILLIAVLCVAGCDKTGSTSSQQTKKGELDRQFVNALIGKSDRAQREQFATDSHNKSITLSGTVGEMWPGSPVTGWFFYLDTPDVSTQTTKKLLIQIDLDKKKFTSTAFSEQGRPGTGIATCQYPDNSAVTIKNGDSVTITGVVWDYNDDFLGGSLLWIADASINR